PRKPLLEDLTNSDEEVFVDKVSPSDLAVIFGTSGSTGYSKLVPRTHADTVNCLLMRDVAWFRKTYGQSVKITMYSDRLLGWIGGFSFYSTVAAVTRVLKDSYTLDESTASQDFWDAVTNEDCTFAIMAPLEVEKRITHITSSGGVFPKKLKYIIVIGQPNTK
uniref:AMP-dependent synthetase/ligase domain-containing protein n=1 Tax=Biomphalaria glabrata TaxID=6526 RepID=A0A2C9KJI3_BIOGL